ncbi:hypothetical protein G3O08_19830 [Cryomorpha ignava]|uniref:Uncharacterized protein n=1 Tax=Cryomorpha ignava TaxID=101383 RepID=A0A7K3WW48_9FLAO|nr:hypothetical protein [Cryomorpha ignava]NEN25744.1 hypothetical protein [Cryomorpha ignava]
MKRLDEIEKMSSKTALKVGLSVGTFFLFLTTSILVLVAGGLLGLIGLYAILSFNNLYLSLILLYLSFPFALWTVGRRIGKNLFNDKSTLRTSFEFSFGVNLIIWTVFYISQLLVGQSTEIVIWTIATVGITIILSILTTFTIGILIVNQTRKKINKAHNNG